MPRKVTRVEINFYRGDVSALDEAFTSRAVQYFISGITTSCVCLTKAAGSSARQVPEPRASSQRARPRESESGDRWIG
eukprot:scaffold2782_cov145-Skeletonema_menzelii.AAC.3